MNKLFNHLFLSALTLGAFSAGGFEIKNGFETWDEKNNIPTENGASWTVNAKKRAEFEIFERTAQEKFSGSWSLHLKDSNRTSTNQTISLALAGNRVKNVAGKVVKFSARVKQVSASKFNVVGIGISWLVDKKWIKSAVSTGETGSGNWQLLECRARIPENSKLVFFNLNCAGGWGSTGEAYFDDMHISIDDGKSDSEEIIKAPEKAAVKYSDPAEDTPEITSYRKSYREQAPTLEDDRLRPEIKNGTWYINGKPEFYLGVWLYNRSHTDWNAKSNPLGIKHVAYNEPPSAELFKKMGFNSSQISAAPRLQPMAINGVKLPKNWKHDEKRNLKFFAGFKDVPMVLDFAFGYHNSYPQKKRLELDQCLGSWHQFFPFCPEHPEGDRYYTDFFLGGTRMAMRAKTNVFLYELFNESSYNCECRYNAADFAGRMAKKYGTISAANARWGTHFINFAEVARQTGFAQYPGLWPDWCKFIGVRYGEILEKYKNVIRSVDKRSNVYFTEQASGTPPARIGFDYTIIADKLDALALEGGWRYGYNANFSATSEAEAVVATDESKHFFNCDFYQGLVQGKKPVVNNEHYCFRVENNIRVPSRREDIITSLWMEILHGVSSNFTYVWDKRSWEWNTFEKAKANVIRPSYKASSMLNPYNWPPEHLDCFKVFRSEFDPYKDKILPFPRVKAPTVAVFFSYPTQRMSGHIKLNFIKELGSWYTRILHAHYPVRVVFERDLDALGSEVEALIFPVSDFVNPDTLKAAEKFRRRGGLVIADTRSFKTDEYGRKLDRVPDFKRAATPQEAIAILDKAEITRYARLTPETGKDFTASDVQIIDRGDFKLVGIVNMSDTMTRAAKLQLNLSGKDERFYCADIVNRRIISNGSRENWSIKELADGIVLNIPPQERVILTLTVKRPENMTLFTQQQRAEELKSRNSSEQKRHDALVKEVKAQQKAAIEARIYRGVDQAKCTPVDLRKYVNMAFADKIAGDRKGGWFDQGANDFSLMPLGRRVCAGVPFEIIDPAANDNRSVIVMFSTERRYFPEKVGPIAVGKKAKNVYFLHTMGWNEKVKPVAVYRVKYSDGSIKDINIHAGKEIGGWWGTPHLTNAKIAIESHNTQKDVINMQCFRWSNPSPEKTIDSIEIISGATEALPAIAAITLEQ